MKDDHKNSEEGTINHTLLKTGRVKREKEKDSKWVEGGQRERMLWARRRALLWTKRSSVTRGMTRIRKAGKGEI